MPKPTAEELADIQGIILSGYGHLSYAAFDFVRIHDPTTARQWLATIADEVTTSKPWSVRPDGSKEKPVVALNIAFTMQGLQKLGLPPETLNSFAEEFREGMASRSAVLGDDGQSAPAHWELGGPKSSEIHVLLMLYGADGPTLDAWLEKQRGRIFKTAGHLEELSLQRGHRPPSGKEHFGFHDGLSQPVIEGIERHRRGDPVQAVKRGEFILGYLNEYGTYPVSPIVAATNDPDQVLPGFPDGTLPQYRDFGFNGTYLVYRKLEQHVAEFWQFMETQARSDAAAMNQLASKCVGRWPSGAPLTLSLLSDDSHLSDSNNFLYSAQDAEGYGCPIGAHVRRANPRDALQNDSPSDSLKTCSRHRIIRRGISFGPPAFAPEAVGHHQAPVGLKDDGQPRGLHFIAINASIARQFEFLMQSWCNAPGFAALFDEKDPIIGNNDGTYFMTLQQKPLRKRIGQMPRFVSVKGGGYCFLPSLGALRFLSLARCVGGLIFPEAEYGFIVKKAEHSDVGITTNFSSLAIQRRRRVTGVSGTARLDSRRSQLTVPACPNFWP